jgi:hypothetical protein
MLNRLRKKKKPTDVPEDRGDSAASARSPTRLEISRYVSAVAQKGGHVPLRETPDHQSETGKLTRRVVRGLKAKKRQYDPTATHPSLQRGTGGSLCRELT